MILSNIKKSPIQGKKELTVTSSFGYRSFVYNGKTYSGQHNGIDLCPGGTVVALSKGKVTAIRNTVDGYNESLASGNYVTLYHGNGVYSTYCHLDKGSVCVSVGQVVEAGAKLGTDNIKTTGFSTGIHLHFGIKVNNTWVDPKPYLLGTSELPSYTEVAINNPTPAGEVIYKVVKGDTLSGIAKKYGTTYQKLAEYNSIANPNIINVGQVIRIPSIAKPVTPANNTYKVVKGDTLSSIAKKYNTNWQTIYAKNKSVIGNNPNNIYPGQVLSV